MLVSTGLASCSAPTPPLWTDAEVALLRSISLASLPPPPPSPSNRFASDAQAARLGESLFFDKRLSGAGDQSCGTCHRPELHFTDGLARGRGVNEVSRNTPSIVGGAWQTWFYWDGRRDSLWAQAVIPIEAPDEMAGSRSGTVRLIASDPGYAAAYGEVFGPLPATLQPQSLPKHAGAFTDAAGKTAWAKLSVARQRAVNVVYANVGKAIAAFERTVVPTASDFDRYVETLIEKGERAAAASGLLTDEQIEGARLFVDVEKTGCLQCHNGPLLTNGGFHNIGTGGMQAALPDMGRLLGVQSVLLDEFNCTGDYSDAQANDCSALRFLARDDHGDAAGAFKVPSLRNVAQTAPYLHDGRFATLEETLAHYNQPPATSHELLTLNLGDDELTALGAFLTSLSTPPPPARVAVLSAPVSRP
ncbi:MAG: cytochrome-c peroxidase [Gammaproteobacteria bacterium]